MDRRELLGVLGMAAATASAVPAFAQHEHHGSEGAHKSLADAASACSTTADACVTHCVEMLAGGDKSLQYCAATSREVATNDSATNIRSQIAVVGRAFMSRVSP